MSYSRYHRNAHFNSIPDRWLRCPRKSLQLIKGKFLIFKTPLDSRYNDQVPAACLFPVDFIFGSMKSYNLKLGLWIDLTNTSRFYNKEDVERHDCKYLKLQCKGFGSTPSREQTDTFNAICHSFISSKPLEIIGVHCTHGFNRSGFMVVSFLVEKWDWELKAALMEFSDARPPGIYKKDYLEELYRRYEEDEQMVPEPPPLPDWCYEDEEDLTVPKNDDDDDDNNDDQTNEKDCNDLCDGNEDELDDDDETGDTSESTSNKEENNHNRKRIKKNLIGPKQSKLGPSKRKKEFVKKNPTFMAGVPGVEPVTEPLLGEIQKKVQDLCVWPRAGFPGSQPVSMTVANLTLLSMKPYTVSWKADGVRYLMYIQDKGRIFFIDRDNCVFKVKNVTFPVRKNLNRHLRDTLLDGEMVIDNLEGESIPRYLVYDIVSLNSYPIRQEPFFSVRFVAIQKQIVEPRLEAMKLNMIRRADEPFSIRAKVFTDVEYTAKFLSDKFCAFLTHEPDGLIFQPAEDPYTSGTFENLLKWKPPSLNSVDFKLKITTETRLGEVPRKIGELYVGGLTARFAVLANLKNLQSLDNKIIECKFENNKWVFMRERTDKSFPNSYETAKRVVESIQNPVTQDMLMDYINRYRYKNPMPPPVAPPPHRPGRRN